MADETIDVFYDMDIAQICQHFNKSRNTVDKAVAKLIKDFPEMDWKYKNPDTKRITIKAEGVEKLSSYFRKEKHEISTVEMELRFENEKLQALLEEKEKSYEKIEELYQQKLLLELEKSKQTFLLENKSKEEEISKLQSENESLTTQKESLESENNNLKSEILIKDSELLEKESLKKELEELKKKEAEYNSKSFFHRLFNKI